jgi:hypothetical protein
MGYTTEFRGSLNFTSTPKPEVLSSIEKMFGEDCRDHPEWEVPNLTWMDLEFNHDETGIEWDGSEKTYDMVEKINLILKLLRRIDNNFGLEGVMEARGEDWDDLWKIEVVDGWAVKSDM